MNQKYTIDLKAARRVAAAAEKAALDKNWEVAIAIVDSSGQLIYLQRDKVQLGSVEVAIAKAKAALLFRRPTRYFEEMVESGRQGYLAMPGMLPLEGGVPLEYQGDTVGAIGISGRKTSEDGMIAMAGAAAL